MCFEPVNLYEAGDDTQAVGASYEGKYVCPYCDTELARILPLFMTPGTPGWYWQRKEPIPNKKQGPRALPEYHVAQAGFVSAPRVCRGAQEEDGSSG
jgi:hypothetical protein